MHVLQIYKGWNKISILVLENKKTLNLFKLVLFQERKNKIKHFNFMYRKMSICLIFNFENINLHLIEMNLKR